MNPRGASAAWQLVREMKRSAIHGGGVGAPAYLRDTGALPPKELKKFIRRAKEITWQGTEAGRHHWKLETIDEDEQLKWVKKVCHPPGTPVFAVFGVFISPFSNPHPVWISRATSWLSLSQAKVAGFYWLSKCAQGCETSPEETEKLDELLLDFTGQMKVEAQHLG